MMKMGKGQAMKGFERKDQLFSLCGLNCGLCSMHLDKYCPGCGGGEGNQSCKIAKCSLEHDKVEYCNQCSEFPCEKYEGIDDFDSFITHRNQRKDLEKFNLIGLDAYHSEQEEKVEILQFLLDNYNDGRRKSFFCVAVNLIELEDLRNILSQIKTETEINDFSLKEKAAYAVKLFQAKAEQNNIVLKLIKKPGKKNS